LLAHVQKALRLWHILCWDTSQAEEAAQKCIPAPRKYRN